MCENCPKYGTCPHASQPKPSKVKRLVDATASVVFAIPVLLLTVNATLKMKKAFIIRHNQFVERVNSMPKEQREQFLRFMAMMEAMQRGDEAALWLHKSTNGNGD